MKVLTDFLTGMLHTVIFILLVLNNRYVTTFFYLFFSLFVCVCFSVDLFDENVLSWQGILINGQFPGPSIEAVTNDNLIISVFNALDEPFLISWLVPPSFLT